MRWLSQLLHKRVTLPSPPPSSGGTQASKVSTPIGAPVGGTKTGTCTRCGKVHSAALRGGVTEKVIVCSCGALIRISTQQMRDAEALGEADAKFGNRAANDDRITRRVAHLVGYLRQFRKNATVERQPEYEELRRIGRELDERGGLELMRKVAHRMAPLVIAPPNPYVRDQVADSLSDINGYWDGIGDWQA